MRFLLIASFPDSLLSFRGALIDALIAAGEEVHIAVPDLPSGHPIHGALIARGVRIHDTPLKRTGTNAIADLGYLLRLVALMWRIRPHRTLAYTIKPVLFGTLAARLGAVPHRFALITGLGYAFQQERAASVLSRVVRGLYRLALRQAEAVFFQNPDDEALFRSTGLLPRHIASEIVNGSGVDVDAYRPAPLPTTPRFLMIGRLLGAKGVREYAEAARLIKLRHPEARFQLAGWIDDNPDAITPEELETWIADGRLNFLGRLADVRPAIADANVFVLPSYREGTPRTVLEAMAMGRAIVTTDAPGCRQTVQHGTNGLLVPVKSAVALERALQTLIDKPHLITEMGRQSRQLAETRYDVHKINTAMLTRMKIG